MSPVNIHGKQYVTVAERVAAAHEDADNEAGGWPFSITTEIVAEDEKYVTVKATVKIGDLPFTGHARSDKTSRSIEGQSPLEVAETSAVGRALGFAGYGVDESIASADEIKAASGASQRVSSPPDAVLTPTEKQMSFAHTLASQYTKHVGGMEAIDDALKADALPKEIAVGLQYNESGGLVWKLGNLTKDEASKFIEALKAAAEQSQA